MVRRYPRAGLGRPDCKHIKTKPVRLGASTVAVCANPTCRRVCGPARTRGTR